MRKKLVEVALPLDAINAQSAREKSIRHSRRRQGEVKAPALRKRAPKTRTRR